MIIVRIQGGLGNQMFQYTLAKWLIEQGCIVKIDLGHYSIKHRGNEDSVHNGYELDRIFKPNISIATRNDIVKYARVSSSFLHRILNKFFGLKKTHIKQENLSLCKCFFEEFKNMNDVYLDGYWTTFLYADEIKNTVYKDFEFKKTMNERNLEILSMIKNTLSVSLHVRHGDYLKLKDRYAIPSLNYYLNAIDYFSKRFNDVKFFCFSDDIEWCRNTFTSKNVIFVDFNCGSDSYVDMQLMSLCKHNIIANSTFSMWAAWLNKNPNKIIIRPRSVFVDKKFEKNDMWPENWLIIDN